MSFSIPEVTLKNAVIKTLTGNIENVVSIPTQNTILVGNNTTNTLTNKYLDSSTTIFKDSNNGNKLFRFDLTDLDETTCCFKIPNSTASTMVANNTSQTLSSKTLDAMDNQFINIMDGNISSSAAINATKIHDGTVSNTEFGYLNGVTGAIQTQIDGKSSTSHTHDHNTLTNYNSNEHIDHNLVYILSGDGLTGSGNLTANVSLSLDINSLTADASPDGASDYVVTYDSSASSHKKVLLNNLPGGGGGGSTTYHEVTATATTSTTGTSYIVMNSMTYTPVSGTYHVTFSCSGSIGSHNQDMNIAIHSGGTIVQHSKRTIEAMSARAKNKSSIHSQAVVTVNGSQAIDVRYHSEGGEFTIYERSMFLWKIA